MLTRRTRVSLESITMPVPTQPRPHADTDADSCLRPTTADDIVRLLDAENRHWVSLQPSALTDLGAHLSDLNDTIARASMRRDWPLVLALADYAWHRVDLGFKWRLALPWSEAASQAADARQVVAEQTLWLLRRARLHAQIDQPHMASELLLQVLSLEPDQAQTGQTLLCLGWLALNDLGDPSAARDYALGSESCHLMAHDRSGASSAQRLSALVALRMGDPEAAMTALQSLVTGLEADSMSARSRRLVVAVERDLGLIWTLRRDWKRVAECLARAGGYASSIVDPNLLADLCLLRASLNVHEHRWRQADANMQDRAHVLGLHRAVSASSLPAEPSGADRPSMAALLLELATQYLGRGKNSLRQAGLLFRHTRAVAGDHAPSVAAVANQQLGLIMAQRGQHAQAENRLAQAQSQFEQLDAIDEAARCALARAQVAWEVEGYLLAEALSRQTLDLLRDSGPSSTTIAAHERLAGIMELQQDWAEAAKHYALASDQLRSTGRVGSSRLAAKAARCRRKAGRRRA